MVDLHGVRDTLVKDKARRSRPCQKPRQDGRSGRDIGQNWKARWNKEPRFKGVATSEEGEDIQQDLWENHWAGDQEANSQIFCQDSRNECQDTVDGSAPSVTIKEATSSLRAGDVGASAAIGSFTLTYQKKE
jgi:hypothetical protein